MRTQTFIVSMASALIFAGAAQATPTPFNYYTFDSFTVVQSESNLPNPVAGINWASPAASQPIFGASGTRAAFAFNYGSGGTTTSSVSGGTATFTTTTVGGAGAGLSYSGSAQDLTGYSFSLNLNMTGPTDSFNWEFEDANGGYVDYIVNYTVAGTYTIDLSTLSGMGIDPSTITSMAISIYSPAACSATVSNFGYVPAPGSAALIGLAGLVASRRRRN